MNREELIKTLEIWKHEPDPINRTRNFFITEFEDKVGKYEHVSIRLNRMYYSFNLSINENGAIIIEDFQNPFLSGFMIKTKLNAYLQVISI